jgi:hypothetical protein
MKATCEQIARTTLGSPVKRRGAELVWHCTQHRPDTHPSLAINPRKDVFICGPCGKSGNAWQLAAFLGNLDPSDKPGVTQYLRRHGFLNGVRGEVTACYDYTDEHGQLLYQVVRIEPGRNGNKKDFKQRRPDGKGGWIWNLNGIGPVLFNLAKVRQSEQVVVVEGEKDVCTVEAFGLAGTCNSGGAGKWRSAHNQHLAGKQVVIIPDNDASGEAHAIAVARNLIPVASWVKIVHLPELPPKADISHWKAAGGTREQLLKLIEAARPVTLSDLPAQPGGRTSQADSHSEANDASSERPRGSSKGPSQATRILALTTHLELFHTPDGRPFAQLPISGHSETRSLRSSSFHNWLAREFYLSEKRAASSQAVQDALRVMTARALFDGEEHDVFVRVAGLDGKIYLDLSDAQWRAVEITTDGWKVLSCTPVRFRRTQGMLPIPPPMKGGRVSNLRRFINVGDDEQWVLFVSWLVAALRPQGPYPILGLNGEQGSAKTTAARIVRALIDPSKAPVRASPRDEKDLLIAASNAHVVALDNISWIPRWLSDALCRLSTGGGLSTRQLYTDDDEIIFNAIRPAILNGIGELTDRSDLADRSVVLTLPVITTHVEEGSLWVEFDKARPMILGALLNGLSAGLRRHRSIVLNEKPRMADFAVWAAAAETALGFTAREFMSAYAINRASSSGVALESSVASELLNLMAGQPSWDGTAGDLLQELNSSASEDVRKQRTLPRSARALASELMRVSPSLRSVGLSVAGTA